VFQHLTFQIACSLLAPKLCYDRGKNREKLVCFTVQMRDLSVPNRTIVTQQLHPELRFIRFLEQAI
jgi:hypothetical protein